MNQTTVNKKIFMQEAINLSSENLHERCGWPFGAVIVKDGKVVGKWYNHVVKNNDPTAHWEIMAIRDACQNLWTFDLHNCEIYTSCEPCPMCFWAIARSRIWKIYYANTWDDAAFIGFNDSAFHEQMKKDFHERDIPVEQILHKEAFKVFEDRKAQIEDIKY